jgi:hypothetical protein
MISNNDLVVYFIFILTISNYIYTFHIKEHYSDDIDYKLESVNKMNKNEHVFLSTLNNESKLFGQFCKKIKVFSKNFNHVSRKENLKKKMHDSKITEKQNKQTRLLNEILQLQKKIYLDEESIKSIKNYKGIYNKKFEKQLEVINKAYKNLKDNYETALQVNIV